MLYVYWNNFKLWGLSYIPVTSETIIIFIYTFNILWVFRPMFIGLLTIYLLSNSTVLYEQLVQLTRVILCKLSLPISCTTERKSYDTREKLEHMFNILLQVFK